MKNKSHKFLFPASSCHSCVTHEATRCRNQILTLDERPTEFIRETETSNEIRRAIVGW